MSTDRIARGYSSAVAERDEKVVTLVVAGAKQHGVLGGDALIAFETIGAHRQGGFAVGGGVEDVRRVRAGGEVDLSEVAADEDRLVDEHFEGDWLEVDRAVGRCAGQPSKSVVPVVPHGIFRLAFAA